jgi:hypothetical protein
MAMHDDDVFAMRVGLGTIAIIMSLIMAITISCSLPRLPFSAPILHVTDTIYDVTHSLEIGLLETVRFGNATLAQWKPYVDESPNELDRFIFAVVNVNFQVMRFMLVLSSLPFSVVSRTIEQSVSWIYPSMKPPVFRQLYVTDD